MQLVVPNPVTFIYLPSIHGITGELAEETYLTGTYSQMAEARKRKQNISFISVNRQDCLSPHFTFWIIKGKYLNVRWMSKVIYLWPMWFPWEEIPSDIQLTASSLDTHQMLVIYLHCSALRGEIFLNASTNSF